MSFRDNYKKLNRNIAPSDSLLNDTKEKMKTRIVKKSYFRKKYIVIGTSIAGIALLGFVLLGNNFNNKTSSNDKFVKNEENKNEFELNLKEGQHEDRVVLDNGVLNFNKDLAKNEVLLDFNITYEKNWTIEKIKEHLGIDPRPNYIPGDLKNIKSNNDNDRGVIYNADRNIEYDSFAFSYKENTNDYYDPTERLLTVEVSKGSLPIECGKYLSDKILKSNIGNVELQLEYVRTGYGPYDNDHNPSGYNDIYTAYFMYKDIGYKIQSTNLSQEEFIKVIMSVIYGEGVE